MMSELTGQSLISGEWIDGKGANFDSTNPFSNNTLWTGRFADENQAAAAIQSAREAFPKWATLSLAKRIEVCEAFASLLKERHEELALLITRENGKPLWEARTEVNASIGKVTNSIDAIKERRWTTTEGSGSQLSVTRYRPHGVMVVLGPFNFPAHLPGAHIVPALLAGNTIAFKPSEQTPAVGEFLCRAWQSAGLPAGVLNMVHGVAEVAGQLAFHDETDGVLFTGSHRVGKILHEGLAGKPEKVLALELGGNNALVVDDVADIDAAVHEIILSAFITSGQRCTCARRLFVTESPAAQSVLERLVEQLPNIRVDAPESDASPLLASLISSAAADAVIDSQSKWCDGAVKVHHECSRPLSEHPSVLSPGLIEVENATRIDHETFGPLLLVQKVTDLDEAISEANKSRYGLSAGLLSDDPSAFRRFVQLIRAGIVNWNRQTTGASGRLPFGGIGLSGNHQPSGFFASDYCSFPVASLENQKLSLPEKAHPGLDQLFG